MKVQPTASRLLTRSAQVPLPQQDLRTPLLRRRPRNLPHLRAALLHADIRRIHRFIFQHRSRASRGIQRGFRGRSHLFRLLKRQDRFGERRLDVHVTAGHDHVPRLALRQHSRRADPLRARSWHCSGWLLQHDADRRWPHLWLCEHERYHGHDSDELDFWVFAGTSSPLPLSLSLSLIRETFPLTGHTGISHRRLHFGSQRRSKPWHRALQACDVLCWFPRSGIGESHGYCEIAETKGASRQVLMPRHESDTFLFAQNGIRLLMYNV